MLNVDKIMAYEAGALDDAGTLELFADLIRTGAAWSLQGSYGRTAAALIEGEVIDADGNILVDLDTLEAV